MKAPAKKEVRFIVKSAQEAVERVHAELGPKGRVISVRQIVGSGLQRFLVAPKLEIIATLMEEAPEQTAAQGAAQPAADANGNVSATSRSKQSAAAPQPAAPQPAASSDDGVVRHKDGVASHKTSAEQSAMAELAAAKGTAPVGKTSPGARARQAQRVEAADMSCRKLLESAGFNSALMARLEGSEDWRDILEMKVEPGLAHAVAWLRRYRTQMQAPQTPRCMAFVGGPGSGKTTSLCKLLAREVFQQQRRPEVLRLEVDKPHLDDGLAVYCEVLGLECKTQAKEVDFDGDNPVYIDFPGFSLRNRHECKRLQRALDEYQVDGRVLVLNAAYENEVLTAYMAAAQQIGCQFQVLTHLDELNDYSKLWSYLLDPQRQLLFFANGQNVAGDLVTDCFGYLMERTFPR